MIILFIFDVIRIDYGNGKVHVQIFGSQNYYI